jgi:DNA polymerase III subunit epsilon
MNWLDALRPWRAGRSGPATGRWVVLDVESSGLDPRRDRLLAIAAIAVRTGDGRPSIDLGDSFEVVLRQAQGQAAPDRQNILLHGIGVGAQQHGVEARAALQAFTRFAAGSPLIAFHAAFDRALIERACRAQGLAAPGNGWLDLEPLAAVLLPQVKARSLDEWMRALGIRCAVRHQAAADTLATAELLLKLWPALLAELPRPAFKAVAALAAQRRWMPG